MINDYTLRCYYIENYNQNCPSCGLTRDFKSMLNGNFGYATTFSKNYFLTFISFFFSRFIVTLLLFKINKIQLLIFLDIIIMLFLILIFGFLINIAF